MRTISADKICRGRALLSFQLNFQQFEGCVVAATDYETIGLGMEFGGRQGAGCGSCFDELQVLAAEFGVSSGPGLKAADAVEDFGGGTGKIYDSIFSFQNRGEACLRAVLWAGFNAAGLESTQGFDNQAGAAGGEARCQSFGGVVGRDGEVLLEEDVAGIESGVKTHGGDTGDGFAVGDRPLDGRGAAVFWEQRRVQVDVPERRKIEHPLRNDAAIADDDDGVGLERSELSAEFVVGFDAIGLGNG